jgi:hypothetical protein
MDKSAPQAVPPSRGHAHEAPTASMHASRPLAELPVRMKQVEGQRETRFLQRSLLDAGPFPLPLLPLSSIDPLDARTAMRYMRQLITAHGLLS